MSKKQIKKIIFMGVGCALLLIVGTIYSLLYNDGLWVKKDVYKRQVHTDGQFLIQV